MVPFQTGANSLRPNSALAAETLFLRKQLALYLDRKVKARQASDATRGCGRRKPRPQTTNEPGDTFTLKTALLLLDSGIERIFICGLDMEMCRIRMKWIEQHVKSGGRERARNSQQSRT